MHPATNAGPPSVGVHLRGPGRGALGRKSADFRIPNQGLLKAISSRPVAPGRSRRPPVDVGHDDLAVEAADVAVVLEPRQHARHRLARRANFEGQLRVARHRPQAQPTAWLHLAARARQAEQDRGKSRPRAGAAHATHHLVGFAHSHAEALSPGRVSASGHFETTSRKRRPSTTHTSTSVSAWASSPPASVVSSDGNPEQLAGAQPLESGLAPVVLAVEQADGAVAHDTHQLGSRVAIDDQLPARKVPHATWRVTRPSASRSSRCRNRSTWRMYQVHARAAVATMDRYVNVPGHGHRAGSGGQLAWATGGPRVSSRRCVRQRPAARRAVVRVRRRSSAGAYGW